MASLSWYLVLLSGVCALPSQFGEASASLPPRCECIDTRSTDLLQREDLDGAGVAVSCTANNRERCEVACLRRGLPLYGLDGSGRCVCAWSYRHRHQQPTEAVSGNGSHLAARDVVLPAGATAGAAGSFARCRGCAGTPGGRLSIDCRCGALDSSLWMCSSLRSQEVASPVLFVGCFKYNKTHLHNAAVSTVFLGGEAAVSTHYDAPAVLLSPGVCAAYCARRSAAHTLAGIGNYYHCLCGKALDRSYHARSASRCPPCEGDPNVRCGKSTTVAVYTRITAIISAWHNGSKLSENAVLASGQTVRLRCSATNVHAGVLSYGTSFLWVCSDARIRLRPDQTLSVTIPDGLSQLSCSCRLMITAAPNQSVTADARYSARVQDEQAVPSTSPADHSGTTISAAVPGSNGSSSPNNLYLVLTVALTVAVAVLVVVVIAQKVSCVGKRPHPNTRPAERKISAVGIADGQPFRAEEDDEDDELLRNASLGSQYIERHHRQVTTTPYPPSDVTSGQPVSSCYFSDSSNASQRMDMGQSPAPYDRVSKGSSSCISPMPSSILEQIGMLNNGSLQHTYSSVPVDSGSDSTDKHLASRFPDTSTSSSCSTDNEYDRLRQNREEYPRPHHPPPDSEAAVYSHLKHRGFRNIDRSSLEVGGELGSGHFGVVRSGWWIEEQSGRRVPVAVKTMQDELAPEKRVEFLKEAVIMGQFRHRYIVFLYGVVTSSLAKEVMLVLELLDPKNLREYLVDLSGRDVNRRLGEQLLRFSGEIAEGMAYLASKCYVHRDLAARNTLRGVDGTCKISDFGMSCAVKDAKFHVSRRRLIPVRWTAPEALQYSKYSTCSDIWSYGVLLYEIWSLGKRPYHLWTNDQVVEEVKNGYRLPKPRFCPPDIFEIMTDCWNNNSRHRPTFRTIVPQLTITDMASVPWASEPALAEKAEAVVHAPNTVPHTS